MSVKMPNPNDIERFVLATDGGAAELGAVAYIRQSLNVAELTPVSRDLYDQYFQAFIMTNQEDLLLWEKLHGQIAPATATKGVLSSIANFFTGDEDEEVKKPTPPAPALCSRAPHQGPADRRARGHRQRACQVEGSHIRGDHAQDPAAYDHAAAGTGVSIGS